MFKYGLIFATLIRTTTLKHLLNCSDTKFYEDNEEVSCSSISADVTDGSNNNNGGGCEVSFPGACQKFNPELAPLFGGMPFSQLTFISFYIYLTRLFPVVLLLNFFLQKFVLRLFQNMYVE